MELSTLAVFIPACFALNMAPGPNNLLSISNASRMAVSYTHLTLPTIYSV